LNVLGKIGMDSLAAALNDSSADVRQQAAAALGELGDARAVDLLITALKDKEPDVRFSATVALGKLGDPKAVIPLIALLSDADKYVRGCVFNVVEKIRADPLGA